MRLGYVCSIVSPICAAMSACMLWPLAWSQEIGGPDVRAFMLSIAAGLTVSSILFLVGRVTGQEERELGDAIVATVMAWVTVSAIGALPYWLGGYAATFTDALFESVSAFTTTGATALAAPCPRSVLFWRALTQWLGGAGVLLFGLWIMPLPQTGARSDSPLAQLRMKPQTLRFYSTRLLGVYSLLTAACCTLMAIGGITGFESLTGSFALLSTGGFPASVSSGSPWLTCAALFFMFVAGSSFMLHYRFLTGDFKSCLASEEFRLYSGIVAISALTICADLVFHGIYPLREAAGRGLFQAAGVTTTTGYVGSFGLLPPYSRMLLFFLMFSGGCSLSTAGGIKAMRLLILWRQMRSGLTKLLHPQAVTRVRVDGMVVREEVLDGVTSFFALYLALFLAGTMFASLLGADLGSALYDVASMLGNVGCPPGEAIGSYCSASALRKWLYLVLMLLGRLELQAVSLLLLPGAWRR